MISSIVIWNWNNKKQITEDPSFENIAKKVLDAKPIVDPDYPFESVKNFRDLAAMIPFLTNGKVFRTGHLSNSSEKDVKLLTEQYGVKTLIDLRNSREIENDTNINSAVYQDFVDYISEDGKVRPKAETTEGSHLEKAQKRYFISLMEEKNLGRVLFSRLTLFEKVSFFSSRSLISCLGSIIIYLIIACLCSFQCSS
jgi:hypothetical protein